MNKRPWYKRYPSDFLDGTLSLSLEELGAYNVCIDLIYMHGGPIPDEGRWLAGLCKVSLRKWMALRARLIATGKIVATDGHLSNRRADSEIAEAEAATRKREENGAKSSRKRAENAAKPAGKSPEKDLDTNDFNEMTHAELGHRARIESESEEDIEDSQQQQPLTRRVFERPWTARSTLAVRVIERPVADVVPLRPASPSGQADGERDELRRRLRQAGQLEAVRAAWVDRTDPIEALIAEGFDLDRDVLPVVRAKAEAGVVWNSWRFVERIVRDERAAAERGRPGTLDASTIEEQLGRARQVVGSIAAGFGDEEDDDG